MLCPMKAMIERTAPKGWMTPLHTRDEDESYRVLEGAVTFFVGDEQVTGQPGDVIEAPRGMARTLRTETSGARWLVMTNIKELERFADFGLAICRPLLFASVDPDVATTRAVPVRAVTLVFLVLLGITVAEAVQAVGALLIFGLLVTPAAIAQTITARPYAGMLLSAALAVGFVWTGLVLAFYLPYPVSFFIVGLSFAAYLLSILWPRRGSQAWRSTNSFIS